MLGFRPVRNRAINLFCLSFVFGAVTGTASAQSASAGSADRPSYPKASDEDVQAWRELEFGLFVH